MKCKTPDKSFNFRHIRCTIKTIVLPSHILTSPKQSSSLVLFIDWLKVNSQVKYCAGIIFSSPPNTVKTSRKPLKGKFRGYHNQIGSLFLSQLSKYLCFIFSSQTFMVLLFLAFQITPFPASLHILLNSP
jgi:hypothetical protein